MTSDIPPDTGSADPGAELRIAARTVRERYRKGSAAYGFWRVTAGIWDRWAQRIELGTELSAVEHAEFQAALFSARQYLELRHGGSERVQADGELTCVRCGHVFTGPGDGIIPATELSARLLGHVCASGGGPASGMTGQPGGRAASAQAKRAPQGSESPTRRAR